MIPDSAVGKRRCERGANLAQLRQCFSTPELRTDYFAVNFVISFLLYSRTALTVIDRRLSISNRIIFH